jgi:hypothetical protein
MNSMGRPFLTALVTTIYNLALLAALIHGELKVMEYITAVGPTNAMIIGFWFGERKSLHDYEKTTGEGGPCTYCGSGSEKT